MKIDIIIPAYNAKDTLFQTLSSIAIQKECPSFQVTIVNDASLYQYQEFVDYFSEFFSIQEIHLDKNSGPGIARNIGMQNTNGEYIVFIDSDDVFYSAYSLRFLYRCIIKDQSDLCISNFIYERDQERVIKEKDAVWLHGKIYKRSFLEQHHILFNDSRANEDNGFNRLIQLMNPKISYLDEVTYVYSENQDSITRRNHREYQLSGLEGLSYNMEWAIHEALQRDCSKERILPLLMNYLCTMYYYYLEFFSLENASSIIQWTKSLYQLYLKYCDDESEINLQSFLLLKKQEYQDAGKKVIFHISFHDFLKKVGEVND